MGFANVDGTFKVVMDPELKNIGSSRSVLKLRVRATNRAPKGGDATSLFFDVEAWGDLAVNAAGRIVKGTEITVAGRLQEDEWTGKDGETKRKLKVTASDLGVAVSRWPEDDVGTGRPPAARPAPSFDDEEAF